MNRFQHLNLFQRFLGNGKGSVSQLFALSLLPIFGVVAVAVDFSHAAKAKVALQAAVDSTALMLARESSKKTQAELKTIGATYFAALMKKETNMALGPLNINRAGQLVTLEVNGSVPTRFAGIFGWPQFDIGVRSVSASGNRRIEVALVLDNTGSMAAQNKIGELKKASNTLLTMLEAAADTPNRIRVAVVPYTTRVNLGTSYRDQNWLTNSPTGTFVSGYNVPAIRNSWTGCVADRDAPYNRAASPVSPPVVQSLYPMVDCVDGVAQAQPLTSNWNLLRQRINAMQANGMTNVTLGAQWGFEMLSNNAPFSEGSPGDDVERFMILLTDGENTMDRWGAWNEPRMNRDTQAACDAIAERGVPEARKVHNIKLYTVLVINGNENLLKSCASQPGMFTKVEQASQLESVFRQIANEIRNVRLTM